MDKNEVYSVKIYFIEPIDLISIVITTLIELEYESYVADSNSKDSLLEIIPENQRSVVFLCIRSKPDIEPALSFVNELLTLKDTHVIIGAFVYDHMKQSVRNQFLENGVSIINFSEIKEKTATVMRNILTFFEARGQRAFIRTKTFGESRAYFYFRNKDKPVVCDIDDISAYAFSSTIDPMFKLMFTVGDYISEVVLVLKGIRIKLSVKVIGFSRDKPNLYIFKLCTSHFERDRMVYNETIPGQSKRKIHDYIRKCLQADLKQRIDMLKNPEKFKEKEKRDKKKSAPASEESPLPVVSEESEKTEEGSEESPAKTP